MQFRELVFGFIPLRKNSTSVWDSADSAGLHIGQLAYNNIDCHIMQQLKICEHTFMSTSGWPQGLIFDCQYANNTRIGDKYACRCVTQTVTTVTASNKRNGRCAAVTMRSALMQPSNASLSGIMSRLCIRFRVYVKIVHRRRLRTASRCSCHSHCLSVLLCCTLLLWYQTFGSLTKPSSRILGCDTLPVLPILKTMRILYPVLSITHEATLVYMHLSIFIGKCFFS